MVRLVPLLLQIIQTLGCSEPLRAHVRCKNTEIHRVHFAESSVFSKQLDSLASPAVNLTKESLLHFVCSCPPKRESVKIVLVKASGGASMEYGSFLMFDTVVDDCFGFEV